MSTPVSTRSETHSPPRSRQHALLDMLACAPFLRAEDLALELGLSPSQSASHLRSLEKQRAIAHVSRPTGPAKSRPTHLYFLRPAGLSALRQAQDQTSPCMPWWGTQDRRLLALLPRLDRLLIGHTFLHSLLVTAPRMLGKQGRAAQVRWTWIRDYQQSLPALSQGPFAQAERLFADWLLILRVRQAGAPGEQLYPLFVLQDHACLPQKQIRARLRALLHARALATDLHPQTHGRFPLVMILLSGWHRARHWQRLAAELTHETAVPLRGCLTVIPATQRNGWLLPWQTLHRYGPCENPRALLFPYPPEACPASWLGPSHHGLLVHEARLAEQNRRYGLQKRRLTNHLVGQLLLLHTAGKHASRASRLAGVALERAHYRILELLCVAPLLKPAEIAAFLGIRETSVHQYLAEMHAFHCLEVECLPEETVRRFRLSSQGLHLLAQRHHLQFRNIAIRQEGRGGEESFFRQRGLDKLRRNALLTCGVYAFFAQLAQEAARHGHQLLWWETAYAREQSYYSLARAAWRWEKPHGIGEYQAGARRVRFWLEWHGNWGGGAHQLRTLAVVFAGYASYIRSREWSREGHVLPVLLLVCPDGARERHIQDLAREHLGQLHPRPVVLSTTLDHLQTSGPLAPIWRSVLLPTGEPGGNRQVLYEIHAEETVE